MTTTIVMNTMNAAVSEYDWTLQSVTQTHGASATDGLCTLGGGVDRTADIDAEFLGPGLLSASGHKQRTLEVVFAMRGSGNPGDQGTLRIKANGTEYGYLFPIRSTGVSRAKPGRGIRENYVAYGFRNVDGADFRIDRIEPKPLESPLKKAT